MRYFDLVFSRICSIFALFLFVQRWVLLFPTLLMLSSFRKLAKNILSDFSDLSSLFSVSYWFILVHPYGVWWAILNDWVGNTILVEFDDTWQTYGASIVAIICFVIYSTSFFLSSEHYNGLVLLVLSVHCLLVVFPKMFWWIVSCN
jgi:hypothetical protein